MRRRLSKTRTQTQSNFSVIEKDLCAYPLTEGRTDPFFAPVSTPHGRTERFMKSKHKNTKSTPKKRILYGLLISVFSLLSILLLSSLLILLTRDPLSGSDRYSSLIFAAAGVLAGFLGRRLIGERIFLVCPALTVLIALLLGLFLSGGHIAPSALLSEGIYLASAALTFYAAATKKKKRHH